MKKIEIEEQEQEKWKKVTCWDKDAIKKYRENGNNIRKN